MSFNTNSHVKGMMVSSPRSPTALLGFLARAQGGETLLAVTQSDIALSTSFCPSVLPASVRPSFTLAKAAARVSDMTRPVFASSESHSASACDLAEGGGVEPQALLRCPRAGFRDRLPPAQRHLPVNVLVEGAGIEPARPYLGAHGLASRCITALPTFRQNDGDRDRLLNRAWRNFTRRGLYMTLEQSSTIEGDSIK